MLRKILILLLYLSISCQASTWYVATNGNNSASGTSWSNAKRSIQNAVDAAAENDTVMVSDGTYGLQGIDGNGSMVGAVVIEKNLSLVSLNGRSKTRIMGNRYQASPKSTFQRCIYADPSKNITISGFSLCEGFPLQANGGGVYGGTLTNCFITRCRALNGAGAYGSTLYNTVVFNNFAEISGGGAYRCDMYNCYVSYNERAMGNSSGIAATDSSLYNCTVDGDVTDMFYCNIFNSIIYDAVSFRAASTHYSSVSNSCFFRWNVSGLPDTCFVADPQRYIEFEEDVPSGWYRIPKAKIRSSSPCVDAGNNSWVFYDKDDSDKPRIIFNAVDIGCWEYTNAVNQSISFSSIPDFTYGDSTTVSLHAVSSSGFIPVYSSSDTNIIDANGNVNGAGGVTLSAFFKGTSKFNETNAQQTVIVGKKNLNVSFQGFTRPYATVNPDNLNITYSGFVFGQNENVLDVKPNFNKNAFPTYSSPVGVYVVPYTNGTDNNYSFTYYPSNIFINPKPMKVWAKPFYKNKGDFHHGNVSETMNEGLSPFTGDYISYLATTSAGYQASAQVGSYPIVPTNIIGISGLKTNYSVTYSNTVLTVVPYLSISPVSGFYPSNFFVTVTGSSGSSSYWSTNNASLENFTSYSAPVLISMNPVGVMFRAFSVESGITSPVSYVSYSQIVEEPTFTPEGKAFSGSINVSIQSVTEGASVYYTTNGYMPTESDILYTGPITFNGGRSILKAKAFKTGISPSSTHYGFYMEPDQNSDTTDNDGDGLPDLWESHFGLSTNSASGINGAWGDPDNDGLPNIAEYMAGATSVNAMNYKALPWGITNLCPTNASSLGSGTFDFDAKPTGSKVNLGFMFSDHDFIDDAWEDANGFDKRVDGKGDTLEGWDLWGRCRASMDGYKPQLKLTVSYNGQKSISSLTVYGYSDMSKKHDVSFSIGSPNTTYCLTNSLEGKIRATTKYWVVCGTGSEYAGWGTFDSNLKYGVNSISIEVVDDDNANRFFMIPSTGPVRMTRDTTVIFETTNSYPRIYTPLDYGLICWVNTTAASTPHNVWLGSGTPIQSNTLVRAFTNEWKSSAEKAVLKYPVASASVYEASPEFRWEMPDGYNFFRLQIKNGSTVYDSGVLPVPPSNKEGESVWKVPVSQDRYLSTGKMFSNGTYTWTVTAYNGKFSDVCFSPSESTASTFQYGLPDVSSGTEDILALVKYSGAATSFTNKVVIEAYDNPLFAGNPVSTKTLFTNEFDALSIPLVTNGVIHGLKKNIPYFLLAYIDSNLNGKMDIWESWGYNNFRQNKSVSPFRPKGIVAGSKNVAEIRIEDADSDQDWFPDVWEYEQNPSAGFLLINGPNKIPSPYAEINPYLATDEIGYSPLGIIKFSKPITITLKTNDVVYQTLAAYFTEPFPYLPKASNTWHHIFDGWYTSQNGAGEKIDENTLVFFPNDITLYDYQKKSVPLVDIELRTNNVVFFMTNGYFEESCPALPNPSAIPHQTFSGWWTSPNGNGTNYAEGTTIAFSNRFALFDFWVPTTYTIKANLGDPSYIAEIVGLRSYNTSSVPLFSQAPVFKVYETDVTTLGKLGLGSPEREGWNFLGWSYEPQTNYNCLTWYDYYREKKIMPYQSLPVTNTEVFAIWSSTGEDRYFSVDLGYIQPFSDLANYKNTGNSSGITFPITVYEDIWRIPGGISNDVYKTSKMLFSFISGTNSAIHGVKTNDMKELSFTQNQKDTFMGYNPLHMSVTEKPGYMAVYEVTKEQAERLNIAAIYSGEVSVPDPIGMTSASTDNRLPYTNQLAISSLSYFCQIWWNLLPAEERNLFTDTERVYGNLEVPPFPFIFTIPYQDFWERACRFRYPDYMNMKLGVNEKVVTNKYKDGMIGPFGRYLWNNPFTDSLSVPPFEPDEGLEDIRKATIKGMIDGSTLTPADGIVNVGSYIPNGNFLYDMIGNVSERCTKSIWYDTSASSKMESEIAGNRVLTDLVTNGFYKYNSDSKHIRQGAGVYEGFIYRGGCWASEAWECLVGSPYAEDEYKSLNHSGYRIMAYSPKLADTAIMPSNHVLSVLNGEGSGYYYPGDMIPIGTSEEWGTFKNWSATKAIDEFRFSLFNGITNKNIGIFIMPDYNVSFIANYEPKDYAAIDVSTNETTRGTISFYTNNLPYPTGDIYWKSNGVLCSPKTFSHVAYEVNAVKESVPTFKSPLIEFGMSDIQASGSTYTYDMTVTNLTITNLSSKIFTTMIDGTNITVTRASTTIFGYEKIGYICKTFEYGNKSFTGWTVAPNTNRTDLGFMLSGKSGSGIQVNQGDVVVIEATNVPSSYSEIYFESANPDILDVFSTIYPEKKVFRANKTGTVELILLLKTNIGGNDFYSINKQIVTILHSPNPTISVPYDMSWFISENNITKKQWEGVMHYHPINSIPVSSNLFFWPDGDSNQLDYVKVSASRIGGRLYNDSLFQTDDYDSYRFIDTIKSLTGQNGFELPTKGLLGVTVENEKTIGYGSAKTADDRHLITEFCYFNPKVPAQYRYSSGFQYKTNGTWMNIPSLPDMALSVKGVQKDIFDEMKVESYPVSYDKNIDVFEYTTNNYPVSPYSEYNNSNAIAYFTGSNGVVNYFLPKDKMRFALNGNGHYKIYFDEQAAPEKISYANAGNKTVADVDEYNPEKNGLYNLIEYIINIPLNAYENFISKTDSNKAQVLTEIQNNDKKVSYTPYAEFIDGTPNLFWLNQWLDYVAAMPDQVYFSNFWDFSHKMIETRQDEALYSTSVYASDSFTNQVIENTLGFNISYIPYGQKKHVKLTVYKGSGSGYYMPGEYVNVTYEKTDGVEFNLWVNRNYGDSLLNESFLTQNKSAVYRIQGSDEQYLAPNETNSFFTLKYNTSNENLGFVKTGTVSSVSMKTTAKRGMFGPDVYGTGILGQTFSSWSDGIRSNPRRDWAINPVDVYALFMESTNTLTYSCDPVQGYLTGILTQRVAYSGTSSLVTARANTYYSFNKWNDNVSTTNRRDTLVTSDRTYTAMFDGNEVFYYTATNGGITGTSPQTVKIGNLGSSVTAYPKSFSWKFFQWGDGNTAVSRQDTATVIGPVTNKAYFKHMDYIKLGSGSYALHFAAVLENNKVVAFGDNSYGQTNIDAAITNVSMVSLGNECTMMLTNGVPVVQGGSVGQPNVPPAARNVTKIAAGGWHCLALTASSNVIAWGYPGATENRTNVPIGLAGVTEIAAGVNHSAAVTNGIMVGWGNNSYSQITPPAGLKNISLLAAGNDYTVAVTGGIPIVISSVTARKSGSSSISGITKIVGGYDFIMALTGGVPVVFGKTTSITNVPLGLINVTDIGVGAESWCWAITNGVVVQWTDGAAPIPIEQ